MMRIPNFGVRITQSSCGFRSSYLLCLDSGNSRIYCCICHSSVAMVERTLAWMAFWALQRSSLELLCSISFCILLLSASDGHRYRCSMVLRPIAPLAACVDTPITVYFSPRHVALRGTVPRYRAWSQRRDHIEPTLIDLTWLLILCRT